MALAVIAAGGQIDYRRRFGRKHGGQRGGFEAKRWILCRAQDDRGGLAGLGAGRHQHIDVAPAHLQQPRCRHDGAALEIVDQHHARAEDADILIGCLDELTAGRRDRSGKVARRIFARVAHVEDIKRARSALALPAAQRVEVDMLDAGTLADAGRRRLGPGQRLCRRRAWRQPALHAVIGLMAGQGPAHGAVAQRHHLVRQAGIHQRLGADDAAGATGAIDHHRRRRRRRQIGKAHYQLGARHVDRGRDRDAVEFIERPAIDDDHVIAGIEHALQIISVDADRAAAVLDDFAERLARHVDAREQHIASLGPAGEAIREDEELAVAVPAQDLRRARRQPVAVIDQHDARRPARHQPRHGEFETAERSRACMQQMRLREDELLAHVEQRHLLAVGQHGPDRGGRNRLCRLRARLHSRACIARGIAHVARCGVIWVIFPVARSNRARVILSRLVPVIRTKRDLSG